MHKNAATLRLTSLVPYFINCAICGCEVRWAKEPDGKCDGCRMPVIRRHRPHNTQRQSLRPGYIDFTQDMSAEIERFIIQNNISMREFCRGLGLRDEYVTDMIRRLRERKYGCSIRSEIWERINRTISQKRSCAKDAEKR